ISMSARPLSIAAQQIVESDKRFDDAAARLVLSLDGTVLFANNAVQTLCGLKDMTGRKFQQMAGFADEEEAFRNSPLLFAQENAMFGTLRSGLHTIHFAATGQSANLQFDLITAQDGTRYVVASALEDDATFSNDHDSLLQSRKPPAVKEVKPHSDLDQFL